MKEVKIVNKITRDITNKAMFDTEEEALEWVSHHEAKDRPWGIYLGDRVIEKLLPDGSEAEFEDGLFLYESEVVDTPEHDEIVYERDEDGRLIRDDDGLAIPTGEVINHPETLKTMVHLSEDYEIVLEDFVESYDVLRKEEYGNIGEQLDEIYHDMDAWKTRIAAIKVKYPKPE